MYFYQKRVKICPFHLLFVLLNSASHVQSKPRLQIINFQLEKLGTAVNQAFNYSERGLINKRGQSLNIQTSPLFQLIYYVVLG